MSYKRNVNIAGIVRVQGREGYSDVTALKLNMQISHVRKQIEIGISPTKRVMNI